MPLYSVGSHAGNVTYRQLSWRRPCYSYRLSPGPIAEELYCLAPDRDERAPQLCAETLLTLVQNGYQPPPSADQLKTPKRQRFALRSLALGENFLGGREQGRAGDNDTTPEQYGAKLALGSQVRGSANLQFGTAHAAGPH